MPTLLSVKSNLLLAVCLITPLFILGVWYPYVGQIGALLAALATMFSIYIIPVICYLKLKTKE